MCISSSNYVGVVPVESNNVPDWFYEHDRDKTLKDEAHRLKVYIIIEKVMAGYTLVQLQSNVFSHCVISCPAFNCICYRELLKEERRERKGLKK